ncbi:Protein of unknown function (DUF3067) [Leptolyngbyaceae cyanobacterium JSC-12]|nr:Protein of unknown function (DUF3067) [Leptolyngbyaceae cyanobacterium JSC-12]
MDRQQFSHFLQKKSVPLKKTRSVEIIPAFRRFLRSRPCASAFLWDTNYRMTGQELRQLLISKWGRSYDIQLRRTQGKIFVLIMWKYLEQVSFPMTEEEYLEHLSAVGSYLQAWGGVEQVQAYIQQTKERPRLGKAVSIPLELGERASEWILDQ